MVFASDVLGEHDSAGAAPSFSAAILGAGQLKFVPKVPEQRAFWGWLVFCNLEERSEKLKLAFMMFYLT